jgi:type IV pilus assembly protein PilM
VLAGGCASIPGIDKMIESKTGAQASVANPFANMSISSKIRAQLFYNDAPSLMIACGLALRNAY